MVLKECEKSKKSIKMQCVTLKPARSISTQDCKSKQKPCVERAALKAKRVHFLVNGDRFCKGIMVAVTHKRYRSLESLLAELSNTLSENRHLPIGVRTLLSIDGRKISHIDDLEDGKFYICSGVNNALKKLDYAALNNIKPSRLLTKLKSTQTVCSSPSNQIHLKTRPKVIFVVKSDTKPRKIFRMLLNKQNSLSFDQVLTFITETVKLVNGVRKIFVSSGRQITKLKQFFELDNLFFVYGSEQMFQNDLKLDFEEMKILQSHKHGLRKPANELKNDTLCLDGVTQLPETSNVNLNTSDSIQSKFLNRYTIGDRIGVGHFAEVYQCFDKQNNTNHALKVIKQIKGPRWSRMIENELTILKSISHQNIINLISELVTPTEVYLVMNLVTGGDLFEAFIKSTGFFKRDLRLITRSLASALAYLHGMDIVHRDVKLKNLLVEFTDDGHVLNLKLADFGFAQKVNNKRLYMMCGTPTYIAPEILIKKGYGKKIDIWAAGVILYILHCGFPPFVSKNKSKGELYGIILKGFFGFPEPHWKNVSKETKHLIISMLQYIPSMRFSAEDVLNHPWCKM